MVTDTIAFIKALSFKKVNLLGFSMGGFIAQQMLFDEPTSEQALKWVMVFCILLIHWLQLQR